MPPADIHSWRLLSCCQLMISLIALPERLAFARLILSAGWATLMKPPRPLMPRWLKQAAIIEAELPGFSLLPGRCFRCFAELMSFSCHCFSPPCCRHWCHYISWLATLPLIFAAIADDAASRRIFLSMILLRFRSFSGFLRCWLAFAFDTLIRHYMAELACHCHAAIIWCFHAAMPIIFFAFRTYADAPLRHFAAIAFRLSASPRFSSPFIFIFRCFFIFVFIAAAIRHFFAAVFDTFAWFSPFDFHFHCHYVSYFSLFDAVFHYFIYDAAIPICCHYARLRRLRAIAAAWAIFAAHTYRFMITPFSALLSLLCHYFSFRDAFSHRYW